MSDQCGTCGRNPRRMNSDFAECSHRRRAWSDRVIPRKPKNDPNTEADPTPLDVDHLINN